MAERVWDKFLTEQDKAHLALVPRKASGFGDNPALLLIDLYRWVFGDHPQHILDAVEDWPSSCGLDAWESVPPHPDVAPGGAGRPHSGSPHDQPERTRVNGLVRGQEVDGPGLRPG